MQPPHDVFAATLRWARANATRGRLAWGSASTDLTQADVAALLDALSAEPLDPTTAPSAALASIRLYRDRKPILGLSVHRDRSVRTQGSTLRFFVRDGERLMAWLAARGVDTSALRGDAAEALDRHRADVPQGEGPQGGSAEEAARLAQAAPGAPPAPPPGAELVAVAAHGRLRDVHSDGVHTCALDGPALRWFGPGVAAEAEARMIRPPVAVHRGHVLFQRDGAARIDVRTGKIEGAPRPGPLRRLLAREARRAEAFREEVIDRCVAHFGDAPLPHFLVAEPAEGDEDARSWLLAMPSPNDLAAYEAYGYLGVPPPAALELEHVWVYRPGEGALHALPRRRRVCHRAVPFAGALVALAAGDRGVHAIERAADGACRWWEVSGDAAPALRGEIALPPAALRGVRALGGALLLCAADPLGDRLLRVPPEGAGAPS